MQAAKDLVTLFPVVRDWIVDFLVQNRFLVASQTGRNTLISEVLNLMCMRVQCILLYIVRAYEDHVET